MTAGKHNLLSILFDMNVLFERWLAAELRPIAHQAGLTLKEQSPRRHLAYRPDIDQDVFQTRPDISLINPDKKVVLILDAKWKILDSQEAKLGISQQDLYQLVAYGNLYNLQSLALIYPRQENLKAHYPVQLYGRQQMGLDVFCTDVTQGIDEPVRAELLRYRL